jgi:hypothetical protein
MAYVKLADGYRSWRGNELGRLESGKAKDRERAARQRKSQKEWLRTAKDRPCHDCGVRYPSHVMDFDHRPGEVKMATISALMGGACRLSVLEAEAAKCDVVCANCHRERTHRRKAALAEPIEPVIPTHDTEGWF